VDQAATLAGLTERPSVTKHLNIHGFHQHAERFGSLAFYGSDAPFIQEIIRGDANLGEPMHPALPYCAAEVVWAVREEMARSVEDVLARRTRALFLNARAAISDGSPRGANPGERTGAGPEVAGKPNKTFEELAKGYLVKG